jgi:hypothetical protein
LRRNKFLLNLHHEEKRRSKLLLSLRDGKRKTRGLPFPSRNEI